MSPHHVTPRRIPWGYLIWTMPLAYVFWGPYQAHAAGWEWLATAGALGVVLALFLAGLTYIEHRRLITAICAALLLMALASLAWRPAGGIYFPVVATFLPAVVAGRLSLSVLLLSVLAAAFGLEWSLLYGDGSQGLLFPAFVGAQILLSGLGAVVIARHTLERRRQDKTVERERIAQDLHDVLGHSLSGLALKAELARRLFHSDPARALAEISDVERIARQALEEVRAAIHGYYAGDIHAELERAQSLLQAAGIRVESRCEQLSLPPAQERVLALIVREAVTNILRHSQAGSCRLALRRTPADCLLEIVDDGRGGTLREGLGMRSIRTRAEALGGTAVWRSTAGTCLRVRLPVTPVTA